MILMMLKELMVLTMEDMGHVIDVVSNNKTWKNVN